MIASDRLRDLALSLPARARRLAFETRAGAFIFALAALSRFFQLGAPLNNYDEGVYVSSLRSLASGHVLYSQVYSGQPPLFLWSLLPWYRLFGESLAAARLGVAMYSLIGLAAMWWLGRSLGTPLTGFIALLLAWADPLSLIQAHAVQAESPALSVMILAVALAAAARRVPNPRLAALAGIAFGAAFMIKLFVLPAIIPIAGFLLAPFFQEPIRAAWRARRVPDRAALASLWRACRATVAASSGGALGMIVLLWIFIPDRATAFGQIIGLHVQATSVLGSRAGNFGTFAGAWYEAPLFALGLLAGYAGWRTRRALPVMLAAWGLASIAVLVVQAPLFAHHLALIPPAFIPGAALLLSTTLREAIPLPRHAVTRLAQGALIVTVLIAVTQDVPFLEQLNTPQATLIARAQDLDALTLPGDLVVTDDQIVAVVANREVPASLVDTSYVRIASGQLTAAQVIHVLQDPRVTAVLWDSGRFDRLAGLRAWVQQHFVRVVNYGGTSALFLRAVPTITPPIGETHAPDSGA